VSVHSFTLSYTLGNIKCDSQTFFLAHTLTSPYLGCKPKARVATLFLATSFWEGAAEKDIAINPGLMLIIV
jgi:hypothetical protein